MNSWQFFCRMVLVNALPPTTNTVLSYSFSLLTSAIKSLSPLTMAKALICVVREGHLQRVQRQIDVAAVLVAARRRIALHHLHGVFGHLTRGAFLPAPVGVSELGDDVAALLQRIEHERNIELALQRRFHADLDIVEVDEDGDVQFFFHFHFR